MEKIPTAEEHYRSIVGCTPNEIDQHSCTTDAMISFAKLHVTAALKAATKRAEEYTTQSFGASIISTYPLELIR